MGIALKAREEDRIEQEWINRLKGYIRGYSLVWSELDRRYQIMPTSAEPYRLNGRVVIARV